MWIQPEKAQTSSERYMTCFTQCYMCKHILCVHKHVYIVCVHMHVYKVCVHMHVYKVHVHTHVTSCVLIQSEEAQTPTERYMTIAKHIYMCISYPVHFMCKHKNFGHNIVYTYVCVHTLFCGQELAACGFKPTRP